MALKRIRYSDVRSVWQVGRVGDKTGNVVDYSYSRDQVASGGWGKRQGAKEAVECYWHVLCFVGMLNTEV